MDYWQITVPLRNLSQCDQKRGQIQIKTGIFLLVSRLNRTFAVKISIMRIPLLLRILIAIVAGIALGMVVPEALLRVFITFNGLFGQLLKFIIPLIIVGLVTSAIADVGRNAGRMLIYTVALAYGSTILAGTFSYEASSCVLPYIIDKVSSGQLGQESTHLQPYFTIEIPPIMDVMTALATSFLVGLGIARFEATTLKRCFDELNKIVTHAIATLIVPLLPLYIFGLFLDMTASGNIGRVLVAFSLVILFIFSLSIVLLLAQFGVAGAVTRRNPLLLLWNMLPAYATALGTSSSAATIPITMRQTKKNGVSDEVTGFTIPLCATIHISGSTLKIVACATAIMLMQDMNPTASQIAGFIFMLSITMVAAPGVPGGGIMAALGVLESVLGFSADQQAMMITLYIAMDSFGTACNVTGDGAIALIVDRIRQRSQEDGGEDGKETASTGLS